MKPALTPTNPIAMTVGPVEIQAYVLESGAYRAEVRYLGGGIVPELCESYPTEAGARGHARMVAKLIAAGWSVQRLIELRDLFNPPSSPSDGVLDSAAGRRDNLPCEEDR